ncbi:unnamed protein product [Calicophoron daubneyi]|uniref:Aromatic-L-amino-acid decarboxylase n=1 Tax=Calicophoron daubneyi TaxID=300641 RepID=A0AAV2T755_CALDB
MDDKQFLTACQQLANFVIDYRNQLASRKFPVLPDLQVIKPGYLRPLLPDRAPEESENFSLVLDDVYKKILIGVTHWQHPSFHAYFPTASSYPAMLGDLLSGAIGAVGFSWISCPACTELETITLDWLAKAMELPSKFLFYPEGEHQDRTGGGVIECSASLACSTIVMTVRDKALRQMKTIDAYTDEDRLKGQGPGALLDRFVVYTSDQAHSSVFRAFYVAMLQCHQIHSTHRDKRMIFDAKELENAIEHDKSKGFVPLLCVATIGSTNTCEFDDLEAIGKVCKKHKMWLHVDAAYGGCARLCPEYRHLFKGVEYANSISFNPHKMLMTNFDCSVLWLDDCRVLIEAFNVSPTYLGHKFQGMPDYGKWSLNLGRRFRSLKLWFVLRTFGLSGLRDVIHKHVQLAKEFEQLLITDRRFEVVNDVRFGLVCFQLKGSNDLTKILGDELLHDGRIYLVPGSVVKDGKDVYFLRFVTSHRSNSADVEYAFRVISEVTSRILEETAVNSN